MDSRNSRKLQRVQSAGAPKSTVHFADEVSIQVPSSGSALASPTSPPASTRTPNTSELWSVFSPHPEVEQQPSTPEPSAPVKRNNSRSPEQRLTLIAFRLAVLEKFATGLGKLAFVWATVVLLGGFVSNIQAKDFWTISAVLLTEGTRVFSRSSELEWQQANYSLGILGFRSFVFDKSARLRQTFSAAFDHNHPGIRCPKNLVRGKRPAPAVCKVPPHQDHQPFYVLPPACLVFYAMMLAEASLFLLERAYWEFKLRYQRLLEVVTRKCELDQDDIETMKQYWYTLYSRSLNGSVFDGLGMDLIDFTVEKLQSSIREEQLGSVNILSALVSKGVSREETRRRIGTTPGVVERLLEMITCFVTGVTASGFPLSLDPWKPSFPF